MQQPSLFNRSPSDCLHSSDATIDCNIHVSEVIIAVELGYILYQHFIRDYYYIIILSYKNKITAIDSCNKDI